MMNDSWRESNVIHPRFHALFVPAEGLLQGWHLSDSQNLKTCCFYTAKKITQRRFCTQKPLHREGFTQSSFYTDAFAHRRFYMQKLLHRKALSKEALLHEAFTTHRRFFTKTVLHTGTLTRRCPSFYTEELLHTLAQKQLIELLMWNASHVQKHLS